MDALDGVRWWSIGVVGLRWYDALVFRVQAWLFVAEGVYGIEVCRFDRRIRAERDPDY